MSNLKTCLVTIGAVLGLASGGVLYAQAEKSSAGTMHGAHGQMMQEGSGDMMKMMQMMGQMNQMMENCNKMMQSMAAPQDHKQNTNTTPEKQD